MELYIATVFDRDECEQVLIGAYASKEIAHRELLISMQDYENDVDDELVDSLIEEGVYEGFDFIIRFMQLYVEEKPKKVRLLAAYNVDHDDLSYCKLFKGIRDLTRFCKDAVIKGDLVDEEEYDDYSKGVAAKTKEVVKELQYRKRFFYDSNTGNTLDLYLSDFVNVNFH